MQYVPFLLIGGSVIIRWVLLPRFKSASKAFPSFILGVALAEGCGLMGILVVPEWKAICLALGLLALLQYVPCFASRYEG